MKASVKACRYAALSFTYPRKFMHGYLLLEATFESHSCPYVHGNGCHRFCSPNASF